MISFWWLVAEGVLFLALAVMNRGVARRAALLDAVENPRKARAELMGWTNRRRWGILRR